MDSPGIFGLLNDDDQDFTIDEAGMQTGPWYEGLVGILSLGLFARFSYGGGGTSCDVFIETSLDQGTTAIPIAHLRFETGSAVRVVNLSALTPVTEPTEPGDPTSYEDTVFDGMLGDRFRVRVVTAGTYTGSTLLTIRGCAR